MLILFASIMHLLWGILLLINQESIGISATRVLAGVMPEYWHRALIYIVAGLLPLTRLKVTSRWSVLSLVPQQLLLILSGISAIVSITTGQYADGVDRPSLFIAADQAIYIILAILYSFESIDRLNDSE